VSIKLLLFNILEENNFVIATVNLSNITILIVFFVTLCYSHVFLTAIVHPTPAVSASLSAERTDSQLWNLILSWRISNF